MRKIRWEYENDDGECQMVDIPAKWEICCECSGEGKSSAYLGAITQEDRDLHWSHDEFEDYMNGGYDRTCESCGGSGKVLVPDWDFMDCEIRIGSERGKIYKAYEDFLKFEAEYERECAMERMMGC